MAFVPVPNTALLEVIFLVDGQRCENTLYWVKEEPWLTTELETLCNDAGTYYGDNWPALVSEQATIIGFEATDLSEQEGPFGAFYPSTPYVGSIPTDVVPNNVTLAITFFTGKTGRSNRGRNYWVGLTEGQVSLSEVTTGTITNILAFYDGMSVVGTNTSSSLVVASRFHNGAPRETGVTTPVIGFRVADNVVDSQRRRLPGRGR